MKMIYNGTPINSMKVKHYEISTSDCDMIASDLQAGKTAVARGKKIVGTGKCFEFATYGNFETNSIIFVPSIINTIEIASLDYPVKSAIALSNMVDVDFSVEQTIGVVIIDNIEYPIIAYIENSLLRLNCEKTIPLEVFVGRDNYA